MESGMSDDVERVRVALEEAFRRSERLLRVGAVGDEFVLLSPRVLAAIRAAAAIGFSQGIDVAVTGEAELENDDEVLDASLAALTDHPGGTDK